MKRFDFNSLGLLISVVILPSCAQVDLLTNRDRSAHVHQSHGKEHQSHGEEPDESIQVSKSSSTELALANSEEITTSRDETSTISLDSVFDSEKGSSDALSDVFRTSFDEASSLDEESVAQAPPASLPDGEASDASPVLAPGTLTLHDLEQMALESNPSLEQAAAIVDKGRGIRLQTGLYPNPTVGYFGSEMGDGNTAGQQGGFVSQTIVTGNKLHLNKAVAGWNIEGLSWLYEAQRTRVLNDVRLRYFDVLGAQRQIGIAEDLARVAEAGVKTARDLFEARQGARPDVLQALVDLNEVEIILQNARYDYDAAWKQLTSVLGHPELVPVPLVGNLDGVVPQYEWEKTYAQLLDESPVLQAARSRVQRARAQILRQEAQTVPNLQTQVGGAHDYLSGFDEVNVQVGITLPVFNRNQGNIALAYAEYNRAFRDVERLQLDLRNRLADEFRNMQQANQQVKRYQKDILPTAKENLELTEEGYKQGEFDFLRVLTARRTYYETNLRYVESLIGLRKSDVVLSGLLLTGGLDDTINIRPAQSGGGQRGQALGQQ